jgi:hypothetical protein
VHPDVEQSREYASQHRSRGWKANELKIYWDAQQLEHLCHVDRTDGDEASAWHDPSDAVAALRLNPVSSRKHAGHITYVNQGIEKAVFDVPEGAQIIVLNFAVSTSQ